MRRVLKFYADWCQPCKMLSKNLEEIQTDVIIENIDIDEKMEIAQEYGIRGVPTMVMLDENVEVKRKSGMMMIDQFEKFLKGE